MEKIIKYCFIHILLLLFSSVSYSQTTANWEKLSSPTINRLNEVFFIDSLKGWIVGDSGLILHTSTGGNSWEFQSSGISNEIVDVFFLDENLGWALAWVLTLSDGQYGTRILKTTNGGNIWTQSLYPTEDVFINTIIFLDSLNGWMGGYPGLLVQTTDGGDKWTDANVDSSFASGFPIINFQFDSYTYGYACGGIIDIAGAIWSTTNSGDNWKAQVVGPEPVQQLYIFDSVNVIGVGGDFEYGSGIVKTTNGGADWDYQSLEILGIASALSFRTPQEAWSPLGFAQLILYSTDAGGTWENVQTPDSSIIYDLVFPDSTHGYGVGEQGAIIRYKPTIVGISGQTSSLPQSLKLFQNYPNPFNPVTKIRYEIPANSFISIKVFNTLGEEVKSFEEVFKPAGKYELIFNGSDLPSGVYYYRIEYRALTDPSNSIFETKKMLLIK